MQKDKDIILVTGATGNQGGAVAVSSSRMVTG